MELQLNERLVRITGSACIEKDLGELQEDIVLKVKGTIDSIPPKTNYDGTYNRTFVVKILTVEKIDEKQRTEK